MIAACVALSAPAIAQTETVIWNFAADSHPYARLALDPSTGALYGTTYQGGNGNGTAFSLVEKHGVWTYNLLYAFGGGADGAPYGGLTEDAAGALYGTTTGGYNASGTAFKLTFNGSSWIHTVLHTFGSGSDGAVPEADLTIDKTTGAIYGTTLTGGTANCGTVFELTPSGEESMLYAFQGYKDGCYAQSPVRADSEGMLYGVMIYAGAHDRGNVYRLKESRGVWNESVLYSFTGGNDGGYPSDLDLDPKTGALYGTTYSFGRGNRGVVFELAPAKKARHESILYYFTGKSDGNNPAGLHLDASTGILFGTTERGGGSYWGTVFQLIPNGNSGETQLHSFVGHSSDGAYPYSRPTEDTRTLDLYGTTTRGGTFNGGTAYLIVP